MRTRWSLGFSVVVALTFLAGLSSAAQADSSSLQTDSSWKSTPVAPTPIDPAWNTLGYNDSGWNNAVVNGYYPDPDGNVYTAIYDPKVLVPRYFDTNSAGDYLRKTFTLTSVPDRVTLTFGFDDLGQVFINGHLVFDNLSSDPPAFCSWANGIDVTSYLVPGKNVIAAYDANFPAWNWWGAGGLSASSASFAPPAAVPEPITMVSAFLGIGALGGYVRRRIRGAA